MYPISSNKRIFISVLILIFCLGCEKGKKEGKLESKGYLIVALDSISGAFPMLNTQQLLGTGIHGLYQVDTSGRTKKIIPNRGTPFNDIELEIFNDSTFLAVQEDKFYDTISKTIESSYQFYKITQEFKPGTFLSPTGKSIIKKYWISKTEKISAGLIHKTGERDSGYYQFNEAGILRKINLQLDTADEIKDVLVNDDTGIWVIFERSAETFKYDKYIHKVAYFDKSGAFRIYTGFEAKEYNSYHLLDQGKVLLLDARVLLKLEGKTNDPSGIFLINKDSSNVQHLFPQEQVDNLLTADSGNYFVVSVKNHVKDPEKVIVLNQEGRLIHTIGTFPLTRVLFYTFGLEKDIDNDNLWVITGAGKLYYISGRHFRIDSIAIPAGKHTIVSTRAGTAQLFRDNAPFPYATVMFDGRLLKKQEIPNPDNRYEKTFLLSDSKHFLIGSNTETTYLIDSGDNKLTIGADSFHINNILSLHAWDALDRIWVTTLNGAFMLMHTSKILKGFEVSPEKIRLHFNPGFVNTGIAAQNILINIYADGNKIGTGEADEGAISDNQLTIPFNMLDNTSSIWNKDLKIVISFKGYNNSDGRLEIKDVSFNIPFYETREFFTILIFLGIIALTAVLQYFKERIPIIYKYVASSPWLLGILISVFKDTLSALVSRNINWGLLGILLFSCFITLILLCLIFPHILKSVGDQFPFDILSTGLFKVPSFKKKFFEKYLDALEHRIQSEKGATIDSREVYVPVPAEFIINGVSQKILQPATALLTRYKENVKGTKTAIIGPGGQGKSALLREFLYQYIQLYRQNPSLPVPIYINGSNDPVDNFEVLLKDHLHDYLVPTDFKTQEKRIKSGDYLIVIDDLNEAHGSKIFLKNFEKEKQDYNKLSFIITLRPHETDVALVSSIKSCSIIHPLKIADDEIQIFETAYLPAGETLSIPLRNICRTHDGFYQPILLRLAILAHKASASNIIQLYEAAIRHLLEKNNTMNEYKLVEAAIARICKESYGEKGEREISYKPDRGN